MRYTVFNPFRRVMNETRHFDHTRTTRTSLMTKLYDAYEVFCGSSGYTDGCTHFGVFDYLTLFAPGIMTYLQSQLWKWSQKESGIVSLSYLGLFILFIPVTLPLLALRLFTGLIVIAISTPIITVVDQIAKSNAKDALDKVAAVPYYPKPKYDNNQQSPHTYVTSTGEELQNKKTITAQSLFFWDVPYPKRASGTLGDQNLDDLSIDIMREAHTWVFDQSHAFAVYKENDSSYGFALRITNIHTREVIGIIPLTHDNKAHIEAILALNIGDLTRRLELRTIVFGHIQKDHIDAVKKTESAKISSYDFILDFLNKRYIPRSSSIVSAHTNMAVRMSNSPHSWESEELRWADEPSLQP